MEQAIDLVYTTQEQQVVTDSITIANVFEKRHDKVLRDIRNLQCSEQFHSLNFGESIYENKQGREMPLFIVTENGFYMLAMGYTGKEAMKFKERYIIEFQRMRTDLESQRKVLESMEHSSNTGTLLEEYEDRITIKFRQQREIQKAVQERIHSLFPHVKDKGRRKYYAQIYHDMKAIFEVDSYRDIRSIDYEDALKFIREWGLAKIGES
ncbi:Rha family transcriptional regulator [Evansella clarkii]|uniref:Rha family transcriptional regulator n=1 Tax=Evansella clarkii TaxID=79879 RepID=UPI00142F8A8E|nr:Rha family transcriptional regulator [Evansella clarkii]